MAWAIQWRSYYGRKLNTHLMGRHGQGEVPAHVRGYTRMVFGTRRKCLEFIREHYGYIARRPDLRAAPYGWRMPCAVKVRVYVAPDYMWLGEVDDVQDDARAVPPARWPPARGGLEHREFPDDGGV